MTNPSDVLHSLELDELVQTYKKLVEKWAKLRYSTKPYREVSTPVPI